MQSLRPAALALLCSAIALAGCDSGGEPRAGKPRDDDAATAPSACTSAGAEDLISRFLADDQLDGEHLVESFVAPEPEFEWFSTRDRVGMEVAADRQTLAAYLNERRLQGTQQRVTEFRFNGIDGDHANVSFLIVEEEGEAAVTYSGKAAVHCPTGKLIVWSEGTPAS